MGLALYMFYIGIVGIIQTLFLLLVIFRRRNGSYVHSVITRIVGTAISACAIIPLAVICCVFSY